MTIAVITGGRDRIPTLAELVEVIARLTQRGATTVRNGKARGTDQAVAAFLRARTDLLVEDWPAEDYGEWPWCGPKRNRAMLDGDGGPDLFAMCERPRADFLIALAGGAGTADCIKAARIERGLPVEEVSPVSEPRIWNAHHGKPPGPSIVVQRPTPLGNPWPLELREGETRAEAAHAALLRYKQWLWSSIKPGGRYFDPRVRAALESITADHYLVCTCWPRHCHAEMVIEAWRGLNGLLGPKVAAAMSSTAQE